jgi:hypothetical protein
MPIASGEIPLEALWEALAGAGAGVAGGTDGAGLVEPVADGCWVEVAVRGGTPAAVRWWCGCVAGFGWGVGGERVVGVPGSVVGAPGSLVGVAASGVAVPDGVDAAVAYGRRLAIS